MNKRVAEVDETRLLPAIDRYDGYLYRAAGDSLRTSVQQGDHVCIISGGYGVVLGSEWIGGYEAVFRVSRWPNRIVQRCLEDYVRRFSIKTVLGFAARTSSYYGVLQSTSWRSSGAGEVGIYAPCVLGGGAMVKASRAIGEAVKRSLEGGSLLDWRSSDDVEMRRFDEKR